MTAKRKYVRRQLFVDPKVQGALLTRAFVYGVLMALALFLSLLCWQTVTTGPTQVFYKHLDGMWFRYGPVFVILAMLVPIFAYDIVKLSNRFAGPMLRMRRAMRRLSRGEHVEPVHFRDDDFWRDFADDFNTVLDRIQPKTTDSAQAAATTPRRNPDDRSSERVAEPAVQRSGSASA